MEAAADALSQCIFEAEENQDGSFKYFEWSYV